MTRLLLRWIIYKILVYLEALDKCILLVVKVVVGLFTEPLGMGRYTQPQKEPFFAKCANPEKSKRF